MIRGLRGAITVIEDSNEASNLRETARLVQEMVKANDIDPDDNCFRNYINNNRYYFCFSSKSSYELWTGGHYVPVMCTHEMNVPGALENAFDY